MSEPKSSRLDKRLLMAGCVVAAIGYGLLLTAVVQPVLNWFMTNARIDTAVNFAWVLSFVMLGLAMIDTGRRLRQAYRAGMQSGFCPQRSISSRQLRLSSISDAPR